EEHTVDARPVDGAHAHRARRTVDIDVAALEHARAHRYEIRRVRLAWDHFQNRAGAIVGAEQTFRVQLAGSVFDRGDLGVKHRAAGQEHAVLAAADDLAVLHDHRAERTAPALLDRLGRKSRGFF